MSARKVAWQILNDIANKAGYAHIALPAALADSKLSDRNRALTTELVYGTLRQELTLDWLIDSFSSRPIGKIDPQLLTLLRLALYQLVFLDGIPDHAAVDTSVELAKRQFGQGGAKFVNAILRTAGRRRKHLPWPDKDKDPINWLAVRYSHPRWLVKLWTDEIGFETTQALLAADNERPKVTLRTNTLKTTRSGLIDYLEDRGISARPGDFFPEAIIVAAQRVPERIFLEGLGYAQNEASMSVGYAVSPQPGETVIDLCAGPGGKTTHLAQLMNNNGRIIAIDLHNSRLKMVKQNCERLDVTIVDYVEGDAAEPISLPEADSVLVDAPCSGLGVLSRRADSRRRKKPEDIERLAALQLRLLDRATQYVKIGGKLTYSVCTLTRMETIDVVAKFMRSNSDWRQVPVDIPGLVFKESPNAQFWPHIHHVDGMFIAQFKRIR